MRQEFEMILAEMDDGIPCSPSCKGHISHPCENCGRQWPAKLEDQKSMCGRCYEEGVETFTANCTEHPENLAGQPIGQYHCPDCGAMVLAGITHPKMCKLCIDRNHPAFDNASKES